MDDFIKYKHILLIVYLIIISFTNERCKTKMLHMQDEADKFLICDGCKVTMHGMDDDVEQFLVCDGCKTTYHFHYLPSKLKDVSSRNWYCTS